MIKIISPFYSAGKWYGWEGSGIGIDLRELDGDGILQVEIAGKPHKIDKLLARVIINKYQSIYSNTRTPKLGIIPRYEFQPMYAKS